MLQALRQLPYFIVTPLVFIKVVLGYATSRINSSKVPLPEASYHLELYIFRQEFLLGVVSESEQVLFYFV
jgi:hypothetical protein